MRHSQKAALARVWWINLATCCVHFSAVLMTIILWTDWTVPVTTSFISWEMKNQTNDMGCRDGNCFVKSAFATWDGVPDISLLGLVISFHALSFLWQFCVIFDGPVADFYHADIARGRNTMRWCEYALSAPLMICVISAVLGQVDVVVYALLATCTATLMGLGYLQEVHMRDTIVPHVMGWILFLFTWSPLTFSFAVSLQKSPASPPGNILPIIWLTYVLMITLFGCFGIVQMVHVARQKRSTANQYRALGAGKNNAYAYENVECAYAILSATAKLTLGVLLIFLIYAREDQAKLDFQDIS